MAIDMALRCAIVDEDKPSVFGKRHGARERHDAAAASTGAIYADEARHSLVSLPVNFGIVASPAALMPSRTSTLRTVSNRIFKSRMKERCSTYQRSSANFSSQESALRPFTCAQPDRKSVGSGKSVSVRVDLGGRRIIKK